MTKELIAEIDSQDNVIAVHPKTKLKELKFRHRLSLVVFRTAEDKILLARRAATKFPFPSVWCFAVGGKVRADESYEGAALREMTEESGVSVPLELAAVSKVDLPEEKAIAKIFITAEEITSGDLRLDPEEIEYLQAFTIEEVAAMISENSQQFAPTFIRHFLNFKEQYKKK